MTTTTTAALHQVRWRLIPVANDSPVVFLQQKGKGRAKKVKPIETIG